MPTNVKIGHAVGDENGKANGGFAGDQTGREVRIQNWYNRDGGWEVCIIPTDLILGKRAAAAMTAICENDNIGYNQDRRWTARTAIQIAGSIEGALESEVDCSSAVDIAYEQAGLSIERGYTGNLERRYMATEKFKAYKDAAHLTSPDYAVAGTLYLTSGKHVCMCLNDGKLAQTENNQSASDQGASSSDIDFSQDVYVKVTGVVDWMNVRDNPDGNIVGRAYKGETFQCVDFDGEWYMVIYKGTEAFLSASLVTVVGTPLLNQASGDSTVNTESTIIEIIGNNVSVRTQPLNDSNSAAEKAQKPRIAIVRKGQKFDVMGVDSKTGWYQIAINNKTGYITNNEGLVKLIE